MKKILIVIIFIVLIIIPIFKIYIYIENKIKNSFINSKLNESKNMELVLSKMILSKLFIENLLINSLENEQNNIFIFKNNKLITKTKNKDEIQRFYNNLIQNFNNDTIADILKTDSIFYVYKLITKNPDTLYIKKIEYDLLEDIIDFNNFIMQYYKNSNFAYISWQDSNGIIAGAPDLLQLSKIKTDTFLENIKQIKYRFIYFNKNRTIEFVSPFILQNIQMGILRIGFYTSQFDNLIRTTKIQFFSFLIILISFFIIIMIIINYTATKKEFYNLSNYTGIILQNIDDGLLVLNEDLSIYFINKSLKSILETDDIDNSLNFKELLKQKKGELNLTINKKNKNLLFNIKELITLDNKKQYIIIIKDITELKMLEYISKKKERMSLLGRISSMVAHEIRNPLNSIYIIIQRLHYEFEIKNNKEEYESLINIIYKEINRLNNIVTKFLEYGRLPAPNKRPFFIKDIIENLKIIMSTWQTEKNFSYTINIQKNFKLIGDKEQIYQAIFNIVHNAFQHIRTNGKIIIDIFKEDAYLNINIQNDGEKIPDNLKGQIFDLYFTTKEDGSGFGLPITKKIIEEHNGEITFYSTYKETKFIIKIPA